MLVYCWNYCFSECKFMINKSKPKPHTSNNHLLISISLKFDCKFYNKFLKIATICRHLKRLWLIWNLLFNFLRNMYLFLGTYHYPSFQLYAYIIPRREFPWSNSIPWPSRIWHIIVCAIRSFQTAPNKRLKSDFSRSFPRTNSSRYSKNETFVPWINYLQDALPVISIPDSVI